MRRFLFIWWWGIAIPAYAAPYGNLVRLGADGQWVQREQGLTRAANPHLLSVSNSDEHNGEIAYQTAYDSFMEGKRYGGNRVAHLPGERWTIKITTADGIVLYKDADRNVAVQSPDGKWHVTNADGRYASSSPSLESGQAPRTMVAKADPPKKSALAKAKKGIAKAKLAKAKPAGGGGRQPASVKAPAAPPAVAVVKPADAKPAVVPTVVAPAPAGVKTEPVSAMDTLAKLAVTAPAAAAPSPSAKK